MARDYEKSSLDQVLDALSDERRRIVITYMHTSDKEHFAFDDLVQVIASKQTESTERSDTQPQGVRLALHHQHLPKLDAAGLIEYDPRTGDVQNRGTIDGEFTDASRFLNAIEDLADTIDQQI